MVTDSKSHSPDVQIYEDSEFNARCADFICKLINSRLESSQFCSIGLSGGSTPGGIYKILSTRTDVEWKRIKLFLGDERWVNETDPQSNTRMIRETLLIPNNPAASAQFFPPDTTLDCATGAVRYADLIVEQLGEKAVFDLMLLGVGDDGHTASLFPHSELLLASPDLCAVARHPQNHSTRITVSRTVLERSRESVFIAKGAAKKAMMKRLLIGNEPEEVLPVKIFQGFNGRVHFLLDRSAGSEL